MSNYPDGVTGNEPEIAGYPEPEERGLRVTIDQHDYISDELDDCVTSAIEHAKAAAAEHAGLECSENYEPGYEPEVTAVVELILDHGENAIDQYEYEPLVEVTYKYGTYSFSINKNPSSK